MSPAKRPAETSAEGQPDPKTSKTTDGGDVAGGSGGSPGPSDETAKPVRKRTTKAERAAKRVVAAAKKAEEEAAAAAVAAEEEGDEEEEEEEEKTPKKKEKKQPKVVSKEIARAIRARRAAKTPFSRVVRAFLEENQSLEVDADGKQLGPVRDPPCAGCVKSALSGKIKEWCRERYNKDGKTGGRCAHCAQGHSCAALPIELEEVGRRLLEAVVVVHFAEMDDAAFDADDIRELLKIADIFRKTFRGLSLMIEEANELADGRPEGEGADNSVRARRVRALKLAHEFINVAIN